MHSEPSQPSWWELHVRAARGEQLSPLEQAEYESALAQHDQAPVVVKTDIEELRRLREVTRSLAQANVQLRARVDALLQEARRLESNLNQKTQELLGVTE